MFSVFKSIKSHTLSNIFCSFCRFATLLAAEFFCAPAFAKQKEWNGDLGALSPEDALEYMKSRRSLVIVDISRRSYYCDKHFDGAVNIPVEELDDDVADALYMSLPAGRPVILHCRLGIIAPGAYRRLTDLRQDISESAYISGAPLFDEYNEWLKSRADSIDET